MLTVGSLFDGIGGFPLAAVHCGIIPAWASEIEPFPMAVTKIRFPDMLHVGDITKLDGKELPPVDVICGGSPCQDLSVAGQRRGLAGERSGLFMEQVRIVREMRDADEQRNVPAHLVRPRYMVWENVPGAFSSADGEDFRAVLEEIVRIKNGSCHVPRPDSGRWESAGGIILGNHFSLAWRVLDAQYWGVAQRRRRIFLVADFGGRTAPEILFKQESLFGNPAKVGKEGQGTAAPAKGSADDTGGDRGITAEKENREVFAFHINQREETIDLGGVSGALLATRNMQMQTFVAEKKELQPLLCLGDQGGERMDVLEEVTPTLRAGMGSHPPLVPQAYAAGAVCGEDGVPVREDMSDSVNQVLPVLCLNDQGGSVMECSEDVSGTLRAQEHGHQPLVLAAMSARYGTGGNNVPLVSQEAESFCIAGNIIDRQPENRGNGFGFQEDIAYTLTGMDRHAVFSRQRSDEFLENEVSATQSARQHKDATDLIAQPYQQVENRNLIRRLTPLECERLQGFPDGWTDIPGASDSARYKALGNSVAIPCVDFVLRGIAYFLRRIREECPDIL